MIFLGFVFLAVALLCVAAIALGQQLRLTNLSEDSYRLRGEYDRLLFEKRLLEAEVERFRLEAETDSLTGLSNRRGFELALSKEQARIAREGGVEVCFAVDLDKFKGVNDTLGHARGDAVLRAVAVALRDTSREYDLICRSGGDEFVLVFVLSQYDEEFVFMRCEQLRTAIWNATRSQTGVAVAASIGVGHTLEEADADLYNDKRRGEDTVIRE